MSIDRWTLRIELADSFGDLSAVVTSEVTDLEDALHATTTVLWAHGLLSLDETLVARPRIRTERREQMDLPIAEDE